MKLHGAAPHPTIFVGENHENVHCGDATEFAGRTSLRGTEGCGTCSRVPRVLSRAVVDAEACARTFIRELDEPATDRLDIIDPVEAIRCDDPAEERR
ncbi:MAG: hypothetical protein IRY90_02610 [Actinomadura rubrobrunea]|nr:hypothetical protein [Actinomadura rubrobrunea]